MALIRGYMGKCPCPVCLVPKGELLTATKVPLRTCSHTETMLTEARNKRWEEMERLLKEHGLCDVDVSYTFFFFKIRAYVTLYLTECIFYYAPWGCFSCPLI